MDLELHTKNWSTFRAYQSSFISIFIGLLLSYFKAHFGPFSIILNAIPYPFSVPSTFHVDSKFQKDTKDHSKVSSRINKVNPKF